MEALQRNFVFKGIPDHLLLEVRMMNIIDCKPIVAAAACVFV
jgi:hypothetical protein